MFGWSTEVESHAGFSLLMQTMRSQENSGNETYPMMPPNRGPMERNYFSRLAVISACSLWIDFRGARRYAQPRNRNPQMKNPRIQSVSAGRLEAFKKSPSPQAIMAKYGRLQAGTATEEERREADDYKRKVEALPPGFISEKMI